MKITSKGQVTIPIHIRERLALLPHTDVVFELRDEAACIRRADAPRAGAGRGRQLVERLRGRASVTMTTDQILALTRDADD